MTYKDKLADTRNNLRNMRKAIPDTFAGFVALEQAASADGALDKKQKEFIALGIAVALRCEDCILTHVSALVRIGATREDFDPDGRWPGADVRGQGAGRLRRTLGRLTRPSENPLRGDGNQGRERRALRVTADLKQEASSR